MDSSPFSSSLPPRRFQEPVPNGVLEAISVPGNPSSSSFPTRAHVPVPPPSSQQGRAQGGEHEKKTSNALGEVGNSHGDVPLPTASSSSEFSSMLATRRTTSEQSLHDTTANNKSNKTSAPPPPLISSPLTSEVVRPGGGRTAGLGSGWGGKSSFSSTGTGVSSFSVGHVTQPAHVGGNEVGKGGEEEERREEKRSTITSTRTSRFSSPFGSREEVDKNETKERTYGGRSTENNSLQTSSPFLPPNPNEGHSFTRCIENGSIHNRDSNNENNNCIRSRKAISEKEKRDEQKGEGERAEGRHSANTPVPASSNLSSSANSSPISSPVNNQEGDVKRRPQKVPKYRPLNEIQLELKKKREVETEKKGKEEKEVPTGEEKKEEAEGKRRRREGTEAIAPSRGVGDKHPPSSPPSSTSPPPPPSMVPASPFNSLTRTSSTLDSPFLSPQGSPSHSKNRSVPYSQSFSSFDSYDSSISTNSLLSLAFWTSPLVETDERSEEDGGVNRRRHHSTSLAHNNVGESDTVECSSTVEEEEDFICEADEGWVDRLFYEMEEKKKKKKKKRKRKREGREWSNVLGKDTAETVSPPLPLSPITVSTAEMTTTRTPTMNRDKNKDNNHDHLDKNATDKKEEIHTREGINKEERKKKEAREGGTEQGGGGPGAAAGDGDGGGGEAVVVGGGGAPAAAQSTMPTTSTTTSNKMMTITPPIPPLHPPLWRATDTDGQIPRSPSSPKKSPEKRAERGERKEFPFFLMEEEDMARSNNLEFLDEFREIIKSETYAPIRRSIIEYITNTLKKSESERNTSNNTLQDLPHMMMFGMSTSTSMNNTSSTSSNNNNNNNPPNANGNANNKARGDGKKCPYPSTAAAAAGGGGGGAGGTSSFSSFPKLSSFTFPTPSRSPSSSATTGACGNNCSTSGSGATAAASIASSSAQCSVDHGYRAFMTRCLEDVFDLEWPDNEKRGEKGGEEGGEKRKGGEGSKKSEMLKKENTEKEAKKRECSDVALQQVELASSTSMGGFLLPSSPLASLWKKGPVVVKERSRGEGSSASLQSISGRRNTHQFPTTAPLWQASKAASHNYYPPTQTPRNRPIGNNCPILASPRHPMSNPDGPPTSNPRAFPNRPAASLSPPRCPFHLAGLVGGGGTPTIPSEAPSQYGPQAGPSPMVNKRHKSRKKKKNTGATTRDDGNGDGDGGKIKTDGMRKRREAEDEEDNKEKKEEKEGRERRNRFRAIGECIEEYVTTTLYHLLFPSYHNAYQVLQTRIEKLQHLKASDLFCFSEIEEHPTVQRAAEELDRMRLFKAPQQKLQCAMNCRRILKEGCDDIAALRAYYVGELKAMISPHGKRKGGRCGSLSLAALASPAKNHPLQAQQQQPQQGSLHKNRHSVSTAPPSLHYSFLLGAHKNALCNFLPGAGTDGDNGSGTGDGGACGSGRTGGRWTGGGGEVLGVAPTTLIGARGGGSNTSPLKATTASTTTPSFPFPSIVPEDPAASLSENEVFFCLLTFMMLRYGCSLSFLENISFLLHYRMAVLCSPEELDTLTTLHGVVYFLSCCQENGRMYNTWTFSSSLVESPLPLLAPVSMEAMKSSCSLLTVSATSPPLPSLLPPLHIPSSPSSSYSPLLPGFITTASTSNANHSFSCSFLDGCGGATASLGGVGDVFDISQERSKEPGETVVSSSTPPTYFQSSTSLHGGGYGSNNNNKHYHVPNSSTGEMNHPCAPSLLSTVGKFGGSAAPFGVSVEFPPFIPSIFYQQQTTSREGNDESDVCSPEEWITTTTGGVGVAAEKAAGDQEDEVEDRGVKKRVRTQLTAAKSKEEGTPVRRISFSSSHSPSFSTLSPGPASPSSLEPLANHRTPSPLSFTLPRRRMRRDMSCVGEEEERSVKGRPQTEEKENKKENKKEKTGKKGMTEAGVGNRFWRDEKQKKEEKKEGHHDEGQAIHSQKDKKENRGEDEKNAKKKKEGKKEEDGGGPGVGESIDLKMLQTGGDGSDLPFLHFANAFSSSSYGKDTASTHLSTSFHQQQCMEGELCNSRDVLCLDKTEDGGTHGRTGTSLSKESPRAADGGSGHRGGRRTNTNSHPHHRSTDHQQDNTSLPPHPTDPFGTPLPTSPLSEEQQGGGKEGGGRGRLWRASAPSGPSGVEGPLPVLLENRGGKGTEGRGREGRSGGLGSPVGLREHSPKYRKESSFPSNPIDPTSTPTTTSLFSTSSSAGRPLPLSLPPPSWSTSAGESSSGSFGQGGGRKRREGGKEK